VSDLGKSKFPDIYVPEIRFWPEFQILSPYSGYSVPSEKSGIWQTLGILSKLGPGIILPRKLGKGEGKLYLRPIKYIPPAKILFSLPNERFSLPVPCLELNVEGVVRVSGVPRLPIQHRDDDTTVAVEAVDHRHLLLRQREVEQLGVLHNP